MPRRHHETDGAFRLPGIGGQLWSTAKRGLVVSGFESPSAAGDPSTRSFHEPLSTTLQDVAPGQRFTRSGRPRPGYLRRAQTTGEWGPRQHQLHPGAADRPASRPDLAHCPAPARPDGQGLLSRPCTPVVGIPCRGPIGHGTPASGKQARRRRGRRHPLAPFLASCGYLVDTVDPSENRRTWPPQPDWDEWDFLDYGAVGLANRSWNGTSVNCLFDRRYDGVYWVSVIETYPPPFAGHCCQRSPPGPDSAEWSF